MVCDSSRPTLFKSQIPAASEHGELAESGNRRFRVASGI
jgi:hypothetical protein